MALDPSVLETLHQLEPSSTEPEPSNHPARTFLHGLGLDTSTFPSVRFLVETSEKSIRVGRSMIPLRLPDEPGYVYESIARIVRCLEVPAVNGRGHRKFLEIEWIIADEPSIDENNHPALSFLAAQVECASCREIFVPDPEVLSNTSVRLACPNCLNYWSVTVSASQVKSESPELLFDLFQKDQSKLRGLVTRWTDGPVSSHDKNFYHFFPFHFESWNGGSSLEWLFGETAGWTALSNSTSGDFESLVRGFLNMMALDHFKNTFSKTSTSQLDQTEIQRKTEVARREESVRQAAQQVLPSLPDFERVPVIPKAEPQSFEIDTKPAVDTPTRNHRAEARFTWTAPTTAVKNVPLEKTNTKKRHQSATGTFFAIGAMVMAIVVVGGVLLYHRLTISRGPSKDFAALEQSIPIPAPVATPTSAALPVAPKPVVVAPVIVEEPKADLKQIQNIPKIALPSTASLKKTEKIRAVEKEKEKVEFKETAEQKRLRDLAVDSSFRQGMLHLKLQQAKEAISEFKKVLSLDPKHAESFRGLGLAHVYEQDFEQAISSLNRYLALAGSSYDRTSVEELIATLRERTGKSE